MNSYLAFSPDGNYLASAQNEQVFIWDTNTGKQYQSISHDGVVQAIVYTPDGKKLITGELDGTVRVFLTRGYVQTSDFTAEGSHIISFAVSPDSRFLALASSKVVIEIATGRTVSRWRDDIGSSESINFSPDGKYLVTRGNISDADNSVRVWDVATGRQVSRVVHRSKAVGAAFTSDGEYLATSDGSVRLWRWRSPDLIDQAKAHLTRNLTCEEWQEFIGENETYEAARVDLPACERLQKTVKGKHKNEVQVVRKKEKSK